LGDIERDQEITDAQLLVVEEEPEHLEPSFVGEDPEELGDVVHDYPQWTIFG
jgi:hypothetical protein